MITIHKLCAGAGLAAVIAAGGCVSVLPEQPEPRAVYQLPDPQTAAELQTNVVIREPDASRLFASRKITSQSEDGGFKVVPEVAWAERATRMFQTALLDAFSTSSTGLAVDDVTGVSGEYELYWRVTQFSLRGNEGVCQLQLTLLDGRSREPVAQQTLSASAEAPGRGDLERARALADAGRLCVEKAAVFIAEKAIDRTETGED
jgi:cholesterol transport system auxiliary component